MRSLTDSSFLSSDADAAWVALVAAARLARHQAPSQEAAFAVGSTGALEPLAARAGGAALRWYPERGWAMGATATTALRELGDLYLPLVAATAERLLTVAHLGQSLDGYIATASGDSNYVNGPENLIHLHRMRALSDAVLVGAGTVSVDDPRLTTRLVSGDNPWRVVLDPYGRLPRARRVFADGEAPTLVVRAVDAPDAGARSFGQAEIVAIPVKNGHLDLLALLEALRARGLRVVFVEGGGVTVSAFLRAGLLDRLQVAVAPIIIGGGRPGVGLPTSVHLRDCLRPACRLHRMGDDALFDCDLRASNKASVDAADGAGKPAAPS